MCLHLLSLHPVDLRLHQLQTAGACSVSRDMSYVDCLAVKIVKHSRYKADMPYTHAALQLRFIVDNPHKENGEPTAVRR